MADIRMAKLYFGDLNKVFLADGDALAMDTENLLKIIPELYRQFPSLYHVGIYAGPDSILKRPMKSCRPCAKPTNHRLSGSGDR